MPAGVWLKRKFGLPFLLEVNAPLAAERNEVDGIAFYRLARWSEEMTWRNADIVLPVTQVLGSTIERAGVPRDRIVVNPNGIDPKRFECRLNRDQAKAKLGLSGRLVLGFTGFVRDWHGLEMVIDLLADLNEHWPCHLLVVGDGPALGSLEARARERGVADLVTFTGLVGRDAITDMVRAFDIALQPAVRAYASPLKLVEYMAMECAVVAPRSPNIEEVLTDGQTAILFEPGDPECFRAALRDLCGNSDSRHRLGSAARLAVKEKGLTWESNARRVEGLIAGLLAGTDRKPKAPS
jgi:glycosyltransferase involved in cell wall biosynthesis